MKSGLGNLSEKFLKCLEQSFLEYLKKGARSTAKLKILHPYIAEDLRNFLGNKYQVYSLDKDQEREKKVRGRYIDKKVDIVVMKEEKIVAGFGIKFIMSNYNQNSNNYFETMLGETANIRTNNILYFQIVICFARPPYFHREENKRKTIRKIEKLKLSHLEKYQILSQDNTPIKTLLVLVDFANVNCEELFKNGKLKTNEDFTQMVKEKGSQLIFSTLEDEQNLDTIRTIFESSLVFNNYHEYVEKCAGLIMGFF